MKILISMLLCMSVLSGCVVAPYPATPVYGSAAVVVSPDYPRPHYRDCDGDGVPNWRDHRPGNPYRY